MIDLLRIRRNAPDDGRISAVPVFIEHQHVLVHHLIAFLQLIQTIAAVYSILAEKSGEGVENHVFPLGNFQSPCAVTGQQIVVVITVFHKRLQIGVQLLHTGDSRGHMALAMGVGLDFFIYDSRKLPLQTDKQIVVRIDVVIIVSGGEEGQACKKPLSVQKLQRVVVEKTAHILV